MHENTISSTYENWLNWADFLRRYKLEKMTAWLLEAAGPLTIIGSQALYFGAPLIRTWLNESREKAFGELLENREEALAFAAFLRKDVD